MQKKGASQTKEIPNADSNRIILEKICSSSTDTMWAQDHSRLPFLATPMVKVRTQKKVTAITGIAQNFFFF